MHRLIRSLLALTLAATLAVGLAQADTFVYQSAFPIDSLDPAQAYDTASGIITENVYETLYDYVGESVTEYQPALATDWSASETGDQFTFTLRQGVVFHSGNPFTCADVEYSIKRALVHNPGDSGVWFLAEAFLGTESNADRHLGEDATDADYAAYWALIDNAAVCEDDFTITFNLPGPDPAFFTKMISNVASIVDRDYAIANGLWDGTEATWRDWVAVNLRDFHLHTNPSGTGAYRVVSWDGITTVLEAFDGYWDGVPPIRNVVHEIVEEQSTRLLAIQQGDADRIGVGDRATLGQIRGAPGVTIHEDPSWVSTSVGMVFFNQQINTSDNPDVGSAQLDGRGIPANFFADVDLRKCFAYSFDQQAFVAQVMQGAGEVLTMGLPPGFLGYDPDLPVFDLDPEKAEEHCRLAHGGAVWENGFTFTATYNAGNTTRQAALEMIKDNVEFLNPNFRMNVRALSWPDYLAWTDESKAAMFSMGWAPSYADSDYFLHPFYHSAGFFAPRTGYFSPVIDELINQARATVDADARAELFKAVGRVAYDTMPMLPYPSPTEFIVTRDNIEGVYLNPLYSGQFLFKDIRKN